MKPIPNVLECHYCERNRTHGGPCYGKQGSIEKGCLGFKADERGCIRNETTRLHIPLYVSFPTIGVWCDEFTRNGKDFDMRIVKILNIQWDTKKGNIMVTCDIDYFVNDFADDYKEEKSPKVVLKVIK
ncbi:MAG: hypothetical protein VB018_03820 [Lachnospiraceae bacterium]|nr:hypothetical protein [Lachnospiraceae bacterium]